MKRILFVLLLALSIVSCEDIQENTPAMQGSVENVLFRATDARAAVIQGSGGIYLIEGVTEDERMTIRLPEIGADYYDVAVNREAYATYIDENGVEYNTYPFGDGEIILTEFNTTGGKRVTGTFKFTMTNDGIDTLYVERGIFFEVPLIEGISIPNPGLKALKKWATLIAEFDGEEFKPRGATAEEINNIVTITGSDSGGTMQLRFPETVESGNSYSINGFNYTATYQPAGGALEEATSGGFTIDQHNSGRRFVRGQFSFETPNRTVVNGSFEFFY